MLKTDTGSLDRVNGRRHPRNRRRVWAPIILVLTGVLGSFFLLQCTTSKATSPSPSRSSARSPQQIAIERKGLQELSAETDIPEVTLTPGDKNVSKDIMNSLNLAGDGKDKAKVQQAIAAINNVIDQHPDYADAFVIRSTYFLMSANPDLSHIRSDIDSALKYRSGHKYKSIYSSDAPILAMRAKVDVLSRDYTQAINDLDSAVKIDTSNPSEVFNNGAVKPGDDENPTALQLKDLNALVNAHSEDYRAYMFRGLFYATFTNYDEKYYAPTLADLNRAVKMNPSSALVHYFLGRMAQQTAFWTQAAARDISDVTGTHGGFKEKAREKALQHFATAAKVDPAFAPAYSAAAEELLSLKRYAEAIPLYDKTIELQPDNAGAYNDRGLAKAGLSNYYDALNDYSDAIRIKKSQGGAYLDATYENRAEAYSKTGNYQAAIDDYSRAIGIKLRQQVFLMSLAQIRSMYPELRDISDPDLLEGLRQKYFPNMSAADFTGQYSQNKHFDDFVLAELYVKRGDMYLDAGNFRKASSEYARAVHDDSSYQVDRWKAIAGRQHIQYFLDIQTLDFAQGSIVSLWIKGQATKGPTYSETNYDIDCSGRRIKSKSSTIYNAAGNPVASSREEKWEVIAPETFAEVLYKGMCRL